VVADHQGGQHQAGLIIFVGRIFCGKPASTFPENAPKKHHCRAPDDARQ
jgi:hypothetical protein